MKITECKKCEHCHRFSIGGANWFYGCTYPPFMGRWLRDIIKCPKEKALRGGDE